MDPRVADLRGYHGQPVSDFPNLLGVVVERARRYFAAGILCLDIRDVLHNSFLAVCAVVVERVVEIENIVNIFILVCSAVFAGIDNDYLAVFTFPEKTFGNFRHCRRAVYSDVQQLYAPFGEQGDESFRVPGDICHLRRHCLFAANRVYLVDYRKPVFERVAVEQLGVGRERECVRRNVARLECGDELFSVLGRAAAQLFAQQP